MESVLEKPDPPAGYEEYEAKMRIFNRKSSLRNQVVDYNALNIEYYGDRIDETWDQEDLINLCRVLLGEQRLRRLIHMESDLRDRLPSFISRVSNYFGGVR